MHNGYTVYKIEKKSELPRLVTQSCRRATNLLYSVNMYRFIVITEQRKLGTLTVI